MQSADDAAYEAAAWLVRLRDPACSAATRSAFERWLGDDANRREFEQVERAWHEIAAIESALPDLAAARAKLAAHRGRSAASSTQRRRVSAAAWLRIAAAAAVVLIVASTIRTRSSSRPGFRRSDAPKTRPLSEA